MAKPPVLYSPPVLTREHALEGIRLASFRRRLAAYVIDFVLVSAIFMGITLLALPWLIRNGYLEFDGQLNLNLSFENWYSLIIIVLYFSLSHYWGKGRTIGKKLLKIRVISTRYEKLGLWNCIQRALAYGASTLTGLGFFQVMWKPNRRPPTMSWSRPSSSTNAH